MSKFNIRGHNFISCDIKFRIKYKIVISSDKICINCGFLINNSGFIIFETDDYDNPNPLFNKNYVHVNEYELSCSEIIIKNMLE